MKKANFFQLIKKIFFIVTLVFIFLFTLTNVNVIADSSEAYLITANPAENGNNSVNISWHCDTDTEKYVEYTLATDPEFKNSKKQIGSKELETIYNSSVGGDSTSYRFKATLMLLEEDTEYIYRIVGENKSSVKSFHTGGALKYSAYIISDVHTYNKLSSRLTKAETIYNNIKNKSYNMQLVIGAGDMVAYGTSRDDWKSLLNSNFISENIYASSPGNHDYYNTSASFLDDSYYNSNFNNPNNGSPSSLNTSYYFYYGNVLYISLNSEDACTDTAKRADQRAWLESVLEKNTAQFIVAYFHRSMYPGSGSNTGHASTMKDVYQDLFDKYGVDLVFGGHDHVYVRTNKIYNGTTSTISGVGTQYISTLQIGDRASSANTNMTDVAMKVGGITGGILLSVNSESGDMTVSLYNENNELIDSVGVVSKCRNYNGDRYMRMNVKFSYENTFSSLKLNYGTDLFQRAYKVSVFEDDKEIKSVRPGYNTEWIEDLGASDTDKEKNYVVKIFMRDGTVFEKDYKIVNKEMEFGEISNLKYDGKKIRWDSKLENDIIKKLTVTVNDEEYEVSVDKESYEIALSKYVENKIILKAYNDKDVCLYEEEITYGEKADIKYDYESEVSKKENESFKVKINNSINEDFTYTLSSNSDLVEINGLNVKCLGKGEAIITVTVNETNDSFEIKISISEEAVEEPEEPTLDPVPDEPTPDEPEENDKKKGGCGSAASVLFLSFMLLGLCIIKKKRF